jgi:hypothetical protein
MSGFRTLGFLILAPFVMGGFVIGVFGFDDYNIVIIPIIMIGEAILVLIEVIKVDETEMEVSYDINTTNDSNKDGKTPTEPAV